MAGFLIGLIIFLSGGVLDWLVTHNLVPTSALMLGGAAVATFIGLLVYRCLSESHDHHEAMLDRLRRIAEVNHHFRNALEVILYSSRSDSSPLEKAIQDINAAVRRIEWALTEVLPDHSDQITGRLAGQRARK